MRLKRFCATTPLSDSARVARIWFCWFGRENVDDTIDRLGGARGVQRAENKVTGGCGGQRQFDCFQVAHFADEDDVRVFAQGAAQRGGKRARVHADLAMLTRQFWLRARTRSDPRP